VIDTWIERNTYEDFILGCSVYIKLVFVNNSHHNYKSRLYPYYYTLIFLFQSSGSSLSIIHMSENIYLPI